MGSRLQPVRSLWLTIILASVVQVRPTHSHACPAAHIDPSLDSLAECYRTPIVGFNTALS